MRLLIKLRVLLGKSVVECYKTVKEGIGTHASLFDTFRRWVNVIKNCRERQTMPLPVSAQYKLGETKSLCKVDSNTCSAMTKEPCVLLPPTTCGLGETKAGYLNG
jgi:hypothetical protein